jgi:hypothetical protein
VAHARVEHRHQVERLHHVRAVVAGQAHPGLEDEVAVQGLDLLDDLGLDLGRVAAGLQQRQHQRGELVPHRHGGEAHAHVGPTRVIWKDGRRANLPSKRVLILAGDRRRRRSSSSRISARRRESSSWRPARSAG